MVSFTKDDRGHNDLERMNDDKDNTITTLKQDNKLLAKQVENLIEQKKQLLDNQSKKWYNRTMKKTLINNRVRLIQHNIQIQLYKNIQRI